MYVQDLPIMGMDTLIFLGGLAVQFAGIVWYSRGLVSEVRFVVKKVDSLEVDFIKSRSEISPFIATHNLWVDMISKQIERLYTEISELRKDLKNDR